MLCIRRERVIAASTELVLVGGLCGALHRFRVVVKIRRFYLKSSLLIGRATICWIIWLTRNIIVFDKYQSTKFLHVFVHRKALVTLMGAVTAR